MSEYPEYPLLRQLVRLALSASIAFIVAPSMASESDVAGGDTIKSISRDYVKSLRSNALKEPANETDNKLPSIASSNIARESAGPVLADKRNCMAPASGLSTIATSAVFGVLTGHYYGASDSSQTCGKAE